MRQQGAPWPGCREEDFEASSGLGRMISDACPCRGAGRVAHMPVIGIPDQGSVPFPQIRSPKL